MIADVIGKLLSFILRFLLTWSGKLSAFEVSMMNRVAADWESPWCDQTQLQRSNWLARFGQRYLGWNKPVRAQSNQNPRQRN
ncbi:MAG: hypothetical protein CMJ78_19205 [Planctomycetaceae bacterium]|nr:hypothetical protein [Planctomycetaceae bacterium]